jgi:sulfate adenylyltransferase
MSKLTPPHGNGLLNPLLAPEVEIAGALERAERLLKVPMSSREVSDLLMLAMGAYTPLTGFMGAADWRGCCTDMKTWLMQPAPYSGHSKSRKNT